MYILKRAFSTVGQVIGKHKHKQLISVETEIYSPFINNDVHFRGYPLRMLASQHTFLEVFHLILNAKLPEKSELDDFVKHIHSGIVDYPYVLTENLKILPANIHITDMLISCFSLVNGFENRNYGSLFGQCLGIIYSWKIKKNKNPLCSNNPVADLASRLLFRKSVYEIDDNIAKFINVLLVLSIDHGLTSASYAARICTSELGSAYSSLIAAASIHKTCLVQLDNYDEIINEGVAMLDSHKGYIHGSRIPNELKSVVTARKDPRVGILVDCYSQYCGKEMTPLLELESKLNGKAHPVFEMYIAYSIMELTRYHSKNSIELMKSILTLSRIAGWISHISEQTKIGRRIEHLSAYIGVPPRNINPDL